MATIYIRQMEALDRPFILDSFLHSYGRSAYAENVPAKVLIDLLEPLLIAWNVALAVSADDPSNELYAWICWKDQSVAWIYTKPYLREKKIAKALINHAGLGKLLSAPFVPTKLFGQSFNTVARQHNYTVRFRPYLPLMPELEIIAT